MILLIDASGPSVAPLEAAARLSIQRDLELLVLGDGARIAHALADLSHDPAQLRVQHLPEATTPDGISAPAADPLACAEAVMRHLRDTPGASLITQAPAIALRHAADATLERLPGVPQAALGALHPTAQRRGKHRDPFCLLLDTSPHLDASAEALVAFARMGAAYASRVSSNPNPKIGVLASSPIREALFPSLRDAADRIERADDLDFVGLISGADLGRGVADVVVSPGHIGATVTGLLHSLPSLTRNLARATYQRRGIADNLKLRAVLGELRGIRTAIEHTSYAGAPLLGFNQLVLSLTPEADAPALINAAKLAAKLQRKDVLGGLREVFAEA